MTNSKKPSLQALRAIGVQKHDTAGAASFLELDAPALTDDAATELNSAEAAPVPPALPDMAMNGVDAQNTIVPDASPEGIVTPPEPAPSQDAEHSGPQPGPPSNEISAASAAPSSHEPSDVAHDAMQTGKGFLLIDRYEMALPFFLLATRADPRNGDAWLQAGACHKEMQQYALGVDALMQATRLMPENPRAYQLLAELCCELERWPQAVLACRLCLDFDPENAPVWNILGLALAQSGQYQQAFDALTRAMQLSPGDPNILENLMSVSRKIGEQSA